MFKISRFLFPWQSAQFSLLQCSLRLFVVWRRIQMLNWSLDTPTVTLTSAEQPACVRQGPEKWPRQLIEATCLDSCSQTVQIRHIQLTSTWYLATLWTRLWRSCKEVKCSRCHLFHNWSLQDYKNLDLLFKSLSLIFQAGCSRSWGERWDIEEEGVRIGNSKSSST